MTLERALYHIDQAARRIGMHDDMPDLITYNNQVMREHLQAAVGELEIIEESS